MAAGGRLDGLLRDVLVELSAVEFDSPESADDVALIEILRIGAAVERAAQRVGVLAVAALQRRGVFLSHEGIERGGHVARSGRAIADLTNCPNRAAT